MFSKWVNRSDKVHCLGWFNMIGWNIFNINFKLHRKYHPLFTFYTFRLTLLLSNWKSLLLMAFLNKMSLTLNNSRKNNHARLSHHQYSTNTSDLYRYTNIFQKLYQANYMCLNLELSYLRPWCINQCQYKLTVTQKEFIARWTFQTQIMVNDNKQFHYY